MKNTANPKIKILFLSDGLLNKLYDSIDDHKIEGSQLWSKIKEEAYRAGDDIYNIFAQILSANLNASPFRSIFRIAARFEVNVVLIETPYLDLEFWEAFSHFYSRSFSSIPKECIRMHFIKIPQGISKDLIISYLNNLSNKPPGFEYFGFTTIRPTASFNVGRTAMAFDDRPGHKVKKELTDSVDRATVPFCSMLIEREANVANIKCRIKTVPFMQQDPIIGVCASTAVWVCSRIIAEKYNLSHFTYSDISKFAFESEKEFSEGREFVRGLSIHDIRRSISRMGANPMYISGGQSYLRNMLYSLVESNIPCIACLSKDDTMGHAVAVISHTLPKKDKSDFDLPHDGKNFMGYVPVSQQYFVSDFVDRFYVHDDAYGPYNRLTIEGDKVTLGRQKDIKYDLFAVVIPIPLYVKNLPDTIANTCQKIMATWFLPLIHASNKDSCVLWRILLVSGTDFRQSLNERGYSDGLREKYAHIHMSKYIWLAEFSLFDKSDEKSIKAAILDEDFKREIYGEFIFDSTHPTYSAKSISFRFSNMLTTLELEKEAIGKDVMSSFKDSVVSPDGGKARQICFVHPQ